MTKQHLSVIIPIIISGIITTIVTAFMPESVMTNNFSVIAFYFFAFLTFGASMGVCVGAKKVVEKMRENKIRKIRTRILKRMRDIKREENKNENNRKQIVFGAV